MTTKQTTFFEANPKEILERNHLLPILSNYFEECGWLPRYNICDSEGLEFLSVFQLSQLYTETVVAKAESHRKSSFEVAGA